MLLGIVHFLIDSTELGSKSSTFPPLLSVLTLKSISTLLLHLLMEVAVLVVSSVSVPLPLPRKRRVETKRTKSKLHYCHRICYRMLLNFMPSCIQRFNVELIYLNHFHHRLGPLYSYVCTAHTITPPCLSSYFLKVCRSEISPGDRGFIFFSGPQTPLFSFIQMLNDDRSAA